MVGPLIEPSPTTAAVSFFPKYSNNIYIYTSTYHVININKQIKNHPIQVVAIFGPSVT